MPCSLPEGGYFIMASTSKLKVPVPLDQTEWAEFPGMKEPDDYAKARWFTSQIRVATIPPSAFYEHENSHLAKDWLRFCFCKRQDTLDSAAERIRSNLHEL
jgi:aspartate/methionine/tyrosine aminotransferase